MPGTPAAGACGVVPAAGPWHTGLGVTRQQPGWQSRLGARTHRARPLSVHSSPALLQNTGILPPLSCLLKKKRDLKNPFIPIITGCHPCTATSVIPDRAVPSTCFQATRRKKAGGNHPKLQHRGTSPALWHPKRRERGAERGPALRHIHTTDADGHELQLHLQTPEAHWPG